MESSSTLFLEWAPGLHVQDAFLAPDVAAAALAACEALPFVTAPLPALPDRLVLPAVAWPPTLAAVASALASRCVTRWGAPPPSFNILLVERTEGRDASTDVCGCGHDLVAGSPIALVTLGESRVFRLRERGGEQCTVVSFAAEARQLIVLTDTDAGAFLDAYTCGCLPGGKYKSGVRYGLTWFVATGA